MSTPINKLSEVVPQLSDKIAVWDNANSSPRNTSLARLLTLIEANLSTYKPDTQYAAPSATGFSVTIDSEDGSDKYLLLVPAGTYAEGTIVLPSTGLVDKQEVTVHCTQVVTALTVSAIKDVNGAPTTLNANDFFKLKYDITFEAWYRVG